ncbi:hypothetical protein [Aminobacter ciceronei]|uniref:Uncharacterized protein n=1 Tax=Aminobacter ciceronei TaxID=150723 RepID=A0ABR6C6D6_9HYPH|nr:hypothetical protein [Aminobacter ciceronei]MBA8906790.1 hypothetical protein [Aminobacter ciceronei]MBA9020569.1 hypothetical protein [Aminobacter ciceronei]
MTAVIVRIGLRYGAGYLVLKGMLSAEDGANFATDPDIQMLVGAGLGVVAEGWYWAARKFGWSK